MNPLKINMERMRGKALEVAMLHDDWCPCADGTKSMFQCRCNPTMRIRSINGKKISKKKSDDLIKEMLTK